MSAPRQQPTVTQQSRVLGGLRAAANMTPEERSERARKAALAGAAKRAAEREAAGLPPARKRAPQPSAVELEPWLAEVDRRNPDRRWVSGEERRREAILLLRTAAAKAIAAAMKGRDA